MSKEFKGTKGEWFVMGDKYPCIESKNNDESILITYPTIATVNSVFRKADEYKANAQLIAAAPELLKELQHIKSCCDENAKSAKGKDKIAYKELSEIADSIINKALGL